MSRNIIQTKSEKLFSSFFIDFQCIFAWEPTKISGPAESLTIFSERASKIFFAEVSSKTLKDSFQHYTKY